MKKLHIHSWVNEMMNTKRMIWCIALAVTCVAVGGSARKPQTPGKTYDVVITAVADGRKITAIKAVWDVTGLGLKDAKDLVESAPAVVKTGLTKEEAEIVAAKLRESSLTVEIKEK